MSRREDIDNAIWSDPDFDGLSNEAALLYLWSFTNPCCGMAGIYKIARRKLAEGRLGDALDGALAELAEARFVLYEDGVLWVRSRVKHLRTRGPNMVTSIEGDLEKLPKGNPLINAFCEEYGGTWISPAIEGFDKGSTRVSEIGLTKPDGKTLAGPSEGFQGKGMGKGKGKEFEEWLEHYRVTTGRKTVRGSQSARDAFAARRKEGRTPDDLKLATVGCHSDDYCREKGFDVPETILRASKVERYIQLGRGGGKRRTTTADELAGVMGRAA